MNKIILTITALLASVVVVAQTDNATAEGQEASSGVHSKNRFAVAATLGYNSHVAQKAQALAGTHSLRSGLADFNQGRLSVGIEGGWFFVDNWKLSAELGLGHTYRPGYSSVPGVGNPSDGGVPAYNAVASESVTSYYLTAGVNRYFQLPSSPKLSFYGGANTGIAHSLSGYKVNEASSQGVSVGEAFTYHIALVSGVEYQMFPELFIALQIQPFTYTYDVSSVKPVPGVAPLRADAHGFSFVGTPTLKLGFSF